MFKKIMVLMLFVSAPVYAESAEAEGGYTNIRKVDDSKVELSSLN